MRKQKHQNKRITNKEKQTLTEDMQKIFVAVTLRKNQDGESGRKIFWVWGCWKVPFVSWSVMLGFGLLGTSLQCLPVTKCWRHFLLSFALEAQSRLCRLLIDKGGPQRKQRQLLSSSRQLLRLYSRGGSRIYA